MEAPVITSIQYLEDQETVQVFAQSGVPPDYELVAHLMKGEESLGLRVNDAPNASMVSFALPIAEVEEGIVYKVRLKERHQLAQDLESPYSDYKQIVTSLPVITKVKSSYHNDDQAEIKVYFTIDPFLENAHGVRFYSLHVPYSNRPIAKIFIPASELPSYATDNGYILSLLADKNSSEIQGGDMVVMNPNYIASISLTITNQGVNCPDSYGPIIEVEPIYNAPSINQATYNRTTLQLNTNTAYSKVQVELIHPDEQVEELPNLYDVVDGQIDIPIELAGDPTAYQVQVAGASDANNILNVGYYSAPYPIEMVAQDPIIPTIGDIVYDGSFLTVNVVAEGDPLGVLQILSFTGQIIHTTLPTQLNQVIIPIQLAKSASFSIRAAVCTHPSEPQRLGEWSTSVNLINTTTLVERVAYQKNESDEYQLNATFSTVGGASDYDVHIFIDDLLVEIPDGATVMSHIAGSGVFQCTITYPLEATKVYQLRIRGTNRVADKLVVGPYTQPLELITAAPIITTADYDTYDEVVNLAWKPLLQPSVTGYQITFYDNGSGSAPIKTKDTSTQIYFRLKTDHEYALAVQAISNKVIGPLSNNVNPKDTTPAYQADYYYGEFLITRSDIERNSDFRLQLQQLFKTPPTDITVLAEPSDPKSPFALVQLGGGYFKYYLDVGEYSNVWKNPAEGEKIRAALHSNYIEFLTALEQVPGGLVPGTIPYLQQIITRGFYLTYDETLYYGYGFDPANRYCDLRAGMRVRIDYEQYQFAGPNSTDLQNGMVGNGTSYYHINAYLSSEDSATQVLNLGFDGFLSQLNFTIPELRGGGAGMLDTYFASMRKPYLRIFYPQNFGTPNGAGEANALKNIALVAADTFTQMENATQLFIESGIAAFPADVEVMYFRGRVAIVPEIQVSVNQQSLYVPVGTTLRQLLQRSINLPSRGDGPKIYLNYTFTRGTDNVAIKGENEIVFPRSLPLHINNIIEDTYLSLEHQANGIDTLDLPLLHGDAINW